MRLLHRRTAPPDEGEACLSYWQTDSRTQEVYDWTVLQHNSSPTLVLGEPDIEVGGILVSRREACYAKLSGELKVESVWVQLPPYSYRLPTKAHSCILLVSGLQQVDSTGIWLPWMIIVKSVNSPADPIDGRN